MRDRREDQRRRDDEEQHDRDVAQQILRQAERAEQPAAGEREDREAGDEPGDDRVRPPAVLPVAAPASTIGSTGSTHGEMAVIRPARKAIPSRTSTPAKGYAGAGYAAA